MNTPCDKSSPEISLAVLRRLHRRKWLFVGIGALFLLGLLSIGYVKFQAATPQRRPLPTPNGFDDLVRAGNLIEGEIPAADLDRSLSVVERNREALKTARAGLARSSLVPLPLQRDLQSHMDQMAAIRSLGRLFVAEGRLAHEDGQIAAAARSYIDAVRLGHECMRGGLLIDSLVGLAIESTGLQGLADLASMLDDAELQDVLLRLVEVEQRREPFDDILATERVWQRIAIPWRERVMLDISGQGSKLLQPAIDSADAAYKRGQAKLRLLILDLAVRRFSQDRGSFPESLVDLEPRYIPAMFNDPFGQKTFVYRRRGAEYQLYSVGPDGKDDGGRAITESRKSSSPSGDLLIQESAN